MSRARDLANRTIANAALPKAGGTMTGNIVMGDDTSIGIADDAERIEFDGAGDISVLGANFGIGTSAPATSAGFTGPILEIKGVEPAINLHQSTGGDTPQWEIGVAGQDLRIQEGGNMRFFIDEDGNVGIGTDGPDAKLHIRYGDVVAANTYTGLVVEGSPGHATTDSGINILSTNSGHIYFGDAASAVIGRLDYIHTDNSMRFHTNSGERMRITSDGQAGIGVTPESDWTVTPYQRTALQVGPRTCLWGEAGGTNSWWGHNVYEKQGVGYVAIGTEKCNFFLMSGGELNYRTGDGSTAGAGNAVNMETQHIIRENGNSNYLGGLYVSNTATEPSLPFGVFRTDTTTFNFGVNTDDSRLYAYGIWQTSWSDRNAKKNITSLSDMLSKVEKLNLVNFNWKEIDDPKIVSDNISTQVDDILHFGVIAQEIREIFPTLIYVPKDEVEGDEGVLLHLRKDELVYIALQAIKELSAKVTALEAA